MTQSCGVMVAQVILVHFVEVRILAGLPFFCKKMQAGKDSGTAIAGLRDAAAAREPFKVRRRSRARGQQGQSLQDCCFFALITGV